ncbi:unnamed protein product [Malus baccata var. baccata]
MAATVAAAYFLLTTDYGSIPTLSTPLRYLRVREPTAALLARGMDSEAQASVKEGTMLESKRSKAAGQK